MKRPKPIKPKSGQESVWNYPRPPKLEAVNEHIKVIHEGKIIASTGNGYRVLETSHPPVYYFPYHEVHIEFLTPSGLSTYCEYKGRGGYFHLVMNGNRIENVAWFYADPTPSFAPIKNHLAFYANKVDECYVGSELVKPQPGNFYGGWITSNITGPFKGEPGTGGW